MIKNGICEQATLNVDFALLVKAKRKTHALEMADFQLNDKNINLDRVRLVNEQGIIATLEVERVESIDWIDVELSDYSNLFKVIGNIRVVLRIDRDAEQHKENLWRTAFQIPRSALQDKTTWVIPTSNEPVFTQVMSQSLELSVESGESMALIKAG
ncbi:hypothetical protein [Cohnella silvisoli]|uniref:SLAP domain-containing protein n=1 Tax=Cohnella silvisoli TaxID=2873699 RepID=A0ABV1KTI1_9BACL|nr:hypothetical protein [Cohnella silvisoli]MCD9022864.1 hypothetical protein [Cohnella silvisoli]